MKDRTQELIAESLEMAGIVDEHWLGKTRGNYFSDVAEALERYQRRVVAHHDIATLSEEVLKEYDYRSCPVCARADRG